MKRYGFSRAIAFIIAGVIMLGVFLYKAIPMWSKPLDFYNMDWKDIGNRDHVKLDIEYSIGNCVYVTERNTKTGKSSEVSRIYAIPTFAVKDDYVVFDKIFLVEVQKADFAIFEKLTDETITWWTETIDPKKSQSTKYEFDGYTKKADAQEIKYATKFAKEFLDYLDETDCITKNIDDALFYDYKLVVQKPMSYYGFLIGAGVLLLIGIIVAVVCNALNKSREKKEAEALEMANRMSNNGAYGTTGYANANGNMYNGGVNYNPNAESNNSGFSFAQGNADTTPQAEATTENSTSTANNYSYESAFGENEHTEYHGTNPDK